MLIEFGIAGGGPGERAASTIAHIVVDEIEKWSEQYQIAIKIKFRKNTITLCFDDDKHYLFFGLTFDPKPTYTSGNPIKDFECPWRLLSDHEVQHRQNS
jgi:hypothetical protein